MQQYATTHEVIVVDDNSLDDSKYILGELQKTFKNLQIIPLTQEAKMIKGKKYPLSIGIKEAKHEIVLLTDADCVPASEHWIYKIQDAFTPGIEIVLGYGPYQKGPGLLNKLIRFETFHTALQYFSYALAGKTYMGVGRNLAYRKNLFFQNKGFSSINNIPSGDDDLFINKVATKKIQLLYWMRTLLLFQNQNLPGKSGCGRKTGIIQRENIIRLHIKFYWVYTHFLFFSFILSWPLRLFFLTGGFHLFLSEFVSWCKPLFGVRL